MPDISMCPSPDCPIRSDCHRNEASGTQASAWRQAWIAFTWSQPGGLGAPVECDGYWPASNDSPSRAALTEEPPHAE